MDAGDYSGRLDMFIDFRGMSDMEKKINVYIWGIGQKAEEYLSKNEITNKQLLGFIQSRKTKELFCDKKVFEPQEVILGEQDYILVCVMFSTRQICSLCKKCNIPLEKVIFLDNLEWLDQSPAKEIPRSCCRMIVLQQDNDWIQQRLPVFYSMIKNRQDTMERLIMTTRTGYDAIDTEDFLQSADFQGWSYQSDYCRFRTFELMADEIRRKKISGAVAELGVYKGTFSRLINAKFPEKKLYLFDTFQSFDQNEYQEELVKESCRDGFIDIFKDTSVKKVISDMPHSEQCIFKVGFFPDTAVGMEENRYAFVSIDVDFEKSIYEGLKYFYPRLNRGGAIFVHDYNNCFLQGVKKAVERYEELIGENLTTIPIADEGGTLVILK